MNATKTRGVYKRESRDGSYVYVRRLSCGAEIHTNKDRSEYRPHDSSGKYLGFTSDEDTAEYMATMGFTNVPDSDAAAELCLWPTWNDAVNSGHTVLLGEEGEQLIALPGHTFIVARDEKHGWDVEIISSETMSYRYLSGDFASECVHRLRICPKARVFCLE
jgi:hypothetical protein